MDKYRKVEQKRPAGSIIVNEIRITSQGLVSNYISIAISLLQDRRRKSITLKGMGQAITKTVEIAEIVKRYIPRLHQETEISSVTITDIWEPIEEGLVVVETTRDVPMISITLSINELNKLSPGYQAPVLVERKAYYNNYQQPKSYHAVGWSYGENYTGGRFRNYHNGNYYQGSTKIFGLVFLINPFFFFTSFYFYFFIFLLLYAGGGSRGGGGRYGRGRGRTSNGAN